MKLRMKWVGGVWIAMAPVLWLSFLAAAADPTFEYENLKSFGFADWMGVGPVGRLIEGSDGALYGTSAGGAPGDFGTVFVLNPDGGSYRVLHRFGSIPDDGIYPSAGLIEGTDGVLYGTTPRGGTHLMGGVILNGGTVYALHTDGSGYRVLHSFGSPDDGENPQGELIEGSDGALYGTTVDGHAIGSGTVFRLNKDGSEYSIVHYFGAFASPSGALVEGPDGALYGTTERDGINSAGTIFSISKDGSSYRVLHDFARPSGVVINDGEFRRATLLLASDGYLYGTTRFGGTTASGTVFKIHPDGIGYAIVHSFEPDGDVGYHPNGQLVESDTGMLFGTTPNGGSDGSGTIFALDKNRGNFVSWHPFGKSAADSNSLFTGLVPGIDGKLYGITGVGGSNDLGTVFSVNQDGSEFVTLRSFAFAGRDGVSPSSPLLEGRDGLLYGTTYAGGVVGCEGPSSYPGCGTVFRIDKNGGGYEALHLFAGGRDDGHEPAGGLTQGSNGALYGTTVAGGIDDAGTVFRLNADGTGYAVLHYFSNQGSGGNRPLATVIQGSDGLLYGTASSGGSNYSGTIFKLNTDGLGYTVLHTFGASNGKPLARLMEGSDGALYGTTDQGGSNRFGSVFRLNKDGTGYSILHSFAFNRVDGIRPTGGLVEGSDGAIYGTTGQGGANDRGTVFRLNKDGSNYRILRAFGGGFFQGGEYPVGGVVEGSDGALYGTTVSGGSDIACTGGCGTAFKLNKDGSGYVNRSFTSAEGDGVYPVSGLIRGSDGALYGNAHVGGQLGLGAVFRLRSLLPIVFESSMWSAREGFRFSIRGQTGLRARIQRSADLATWEDWLIVTVGSNSVEFGDPSVGSRPKQFYRAIFP